MVSMDWSVDREDVEPRYGILRGLPDAAAPLRLLGAVLTDGYSCRQRRWLIDNRMADEPLSLVDLDWFLDLARVHSEKLADICVAWVASASCTPPCERLAQQMPFQFCHFAKIDEAPRWLQTQAEG